MSDRANSNLLSEYYGQDEYKNRTAKLISRWTGYEVEFWENNERVSFKMLHEKSRHYAEDACENWVTGIIR